jgi:exosome complex component MTR3
VYDDPPPRILNILAKKEIVLKTGVTASASGSAYLELQSPNPAYNTTASPSRNPSSSGLKLTCTVHGPRPLPRSAPFSPTLSLSAHIKFAPFATRRRRGYLRDSNERDLAVHLETALRGIIIGDRWPKSSVEVVITILESDERPRQEEDSSMNQGAGTTVPLPFDMMAILGGCITVASAAIVDAGIDCVDVACGGVAALVAPQSDRTESDERTKPTACEVVLDPSSSEHKQILAACVVGYLPSRDEITDLWMRGSLVDSSRSKSSSGATSYDLLVDGAVQAARGVHRVLTASLQEAAQKKAGG